MKKNGLLLAVGFAALFVSWADFPKNVANSEGNKDKSEIVMATWNMGFFSNGATSRSNINVADYESKLRQYRSIIYDSIHPDIISINEYNRVFMGKDNERNKYVTSTLLFDKFVEKMIGPRRGVCNALFSKKQLQNSHVTYLESHKKMDGDNFVKNRKNYYIVSDITLGGKTVKLVSVHILFSHKIPRVVQQYQIEELIEKFKKYDRVIICGDWNTNNYSLLKKAGYTLANNGLVTFPKSKNSLDNIVVKGLIITDVRVIKTDLSDHYPLVCKISIK